MANVITDAETNLIKATNLKRAREIDFLKRFGNDGVTKLMEALGATRMIPMAEGTTLYLYEMAGTLENGAVPEGEIIPLTQITQTKTPIGEITLKKWRKAASAESIMKSGANTAIAETDAKLLKLVQKGIRTDFFTFVQGVTGATEVTGADVQETIAQCWGNLQNLYEDDAIEAVYFINPLDIADYLAKAQISTQTAFGFKYVEDFLGMGRVVMSSAITKGTIIATAQDNLIVYYLTMGGDVADTFGLSVDETGLIGINSGAANNTRAQAESLVMSGVDLLVEYAAGVVTGTINPS